MSDTKDLPISWEEFHRHSKALAWRLLEEDTEWKGIIAITRGGLVPAAIMHFAVPNEKPEVSGDMVPMKRGAKRIMALFIATIATAVSFHNFLHLGLP